MMSENPLLHTATADKLSALKSRFIQRDRFEDLAKEFYESLSARLADLRAERVDEVQNISLVADSGSGKTTAIDKLVEQARGFLSETDLPDGKIIQIKIKAQPTFKSVGLDLLNAMEPNLKPNRENWYIWNLVRFHLRENQVLFVHFDEAQHLKMRGHRRDIPEIVDVLKTISGDQIWPVGFILSGTSDLKEILNFDDQIVRRFSAVEFEPLTRVADTQDTLGLIESYCNAAELRFDPGSHQDLLGERVIHAAAYQFGLVIKQTLKAIRICFDEGDATVTIEHFANAYQAEKSCGPGFNPFLVPQFTQINPRQLFEKGEVPL